MNVRRRSGFTIVEVGIASILLGLIFLLVFGFMHHGMGHTKTEVDRLGGVRALVLLRTLIQLDLGNRGAQRVVESPGPGRLRISGTAGKVEYQVVTAGARRGEIYRLEDGQAPRRIGASFRGLFEAEVDSTKQQLVLKIQAWNEGADQPVTGAPPMLARFDLAAAAGVASLAGHFLPVLTK